MDLFTLVERHQFILREVLRHCTALLGHLLQAEILTLDELILHGKFVSPTHASVSCEVLDCVLGVSLCSLEAVRSRNLSVKVNFFLVEDKHVASRHNVALWINEVTTSVDKAAISVIEFAISSLQNDAGSIVVLFKLSEDFLNIEGRQLSHTAPCQSLSLSLAFLAGRHL